MSTDLAVYILSTTSGNYNESMREFIVLGHTTTLSTNFTLDDLPGSAGRLDVLCRCVTSAFFTSHSLRSHVRLHFVLQNEYVIRFEGPELKRVNPDERSTGALFQKVLERRHLADRKGEIESTPGIYISPGTLGDVLENAQTRGSLIWLDEQGNDLPDMQTPEHPIFVLSDHKPFNDDEREKLEQSADHHVSVGPEALHSHQCMTITHHYLDTNGYRRWSSDRGPE